MQLKFSVVHTSHWQRQRYEASSKGRSSHDQGHRYDAQETTGCHSARKIRISTIGLCKATRMECDLNVPAVPYTVLTIRGVWMFSSQLCFRAIYKTLKNALSLQDTCKGFVKQEQVCKLWRTAILFEDRDPSAIASNKPADHHHSRRSVSDRPEPVTGSGLSGSPTVARFEC